MIEKCPNKFEIKQKIFIERIKMTNDINNMFL